MEVQAKGESVSEDGDSENVSDADERDRTASEIDGPVRATSDDYVDLDIPLPWNTVSDSERSTDPESENDESEAAGQSGDATDASGDTSGANNDATDASGDATDTSAADADGGSTGEDGSKPIPDAFEDILFVGPKSAAALRESSVSLSDFANKRVAYRDLTEAGVNPGVAAKIRREHSLSWSFDGGGTDLDRRSAQVRGLADGERAWVAASSGWSDDTATETDGSGDAAAAEAAWRDRGTDDAGSTGESSMDAETAWREQSVPTPVTALDGIDAETARTLRRAGIGSVRRLATADPESVADALDVDRDSVDEWRRLARNYEM
ncbi:helix-hairpin-helix domain-containing protein [Halobellus salinisoli]|uniref:helix-hairpin-helix domain-containing protein n=1 Tax=Halobellus salinisoli TaxID=3108500 RepID=UPI00300BA33B